MSCSHEIEIFFFLEAEASAKTEALSKTVFARKDARQEAKFQDVFVLIGCKLLCYEARRINVCVVLLTIGVQGLVVVDFRRRRHGKLLFFWLVGFSIAHQRAREEITFSRVVITGKTKRRGRSFEASGPVASGNFRGCLEKADTGLYFLLSRN